MRRASAVTGVGKLAAVIGILAGAGCGTTRLTDTQRTATEQLLVSNAIDQAVSEFDFSELSGKSVFFDAQYLEGAVDRGYLVSTVRQQLLAQGCLLQEDRAKATYVVEVRTGGIGTDRHALLVGIPQMSVPALVPGQPSQIPEIPFAKKTDQEGVAKIAVFAYNRQTGRLVWQSGTAKAMSTSKDTWVLGAGPFQRGTIRNGTEFAGEPLPIPRFTEKDGDGAPSLTPVTEPADFSEPASPVTSSKRLAYVLANAPVDDQPMLAESNRAVLAMLGPVTPEPASPERRGWPWDHLLLEDRPPAPATAAKPPAPSSANAGGQAETEPSKIQSSGLPGPVWGDQTETEPRVILDFSTGSRLDAEVPPPPPPPPPGSGLQTAYSFDGLPLHGVIAPKR
jgi:hypothetical protein